MAGSKYILNGSKINAVYKLNTSRILLEISFKFSELVELLIQGKGVTDLLDHILKKCSGSEMNITDSITEVKKTITRFVSKFNNLWKKSNRYRERFVKTHSNWLKGKLFVNTMNISRTPKGRPKKLFTEAGQRSKQNKARALSEHFSTDELVLAAASSVKSAG